MGRRAVPDEVIVSRVVSLSPDISGPDMQFRPPPDRPLRVFTKSSPACFPDEVLPDGGWGPGRLLRGLVPVGPHLPIPSAINEGASTSVTSPSVVHRPRPARGSPVEGSAVVSAPSPLVSLSNASPPRGHRGTGRRIFRDFERLPRLAFLSLVLRRRLSPTVVEVLSRGLRPSTIRQYQSCWASFQEFVRSRSFVSLSQDVVLQFFCHLFRDKGRAIATINTHVAALKDPLWYGFGVSLDTRWLDLLRRSFFLQRPPPRQPRLLWSLGKVLASLAPPHLAADPSPLWLFRRALFLLALASGLRASQIYALSRLPAWTVFSAGDRQVSLAPVPSFLAKNERDGHCLLPIIVPAWWDGDSPHALCPVSALRRYLLATARSRSSHLFVWPATLQPCSRVHIARVLCDTVEAADPGKCPRGHDVRRCASTLHFLRSHSLEATRKAGQWSSVLTFVRRYLDVRLLDVPCVAMSSLPT